MKKSVILTIALLVLLTPAVLSAQGMCASKEKETCKATCKEKMELTEEQEAKIAGLKFEQEISSIKLEAELKVLKLTLKQEMSKDDPSEKELKALVSKIAAIQEKQHLMKIEHMLAMRKILGPENWKMHKKCCGGMGGHGCMGMDCGGGGSCGMSVGCGMGGHCCMGMGCGSAGCRGMGMCGAGCCGTGGRVLMMKGCMQGKDAGENIEQRCIKIEKGK